MISLNKPLKDVFIAIPTDSNIDGRLVSKLCYFSTLGAEVAVVISHLLVAYGRNMTEDIDFSHKAKENGIDIWCDTDNLALHAKTILI
jgi:hypothetical protein